MTDKKESYKGGKNGDGEYQLIINNIPPHKVWIEACAGNASITKRIRPAEQSYLIEAEPLQAQKIKKEVRSRAVVINSDFKTEIGRTTPAGVDTFIFIDPPYMKSERTSQRDIYKVEWTKNEHRELMHWLKGRKEKIMITHPICELYTTTLQDWSKIEYKYMSRRGLRESCIWMNYPITEKLHDYSYTGSNRTERQRIQRKIQRELSKLSSLPSIERNAIIDAIIRQHGI